LTEIDPVSRRRARARGNGFPLPPYFFCGDYALATSGNEWKRQLLLDARAGKR
jgi:hypothetical protein